MCKHSVIVARNNAEATSALLKSTSSGEPYLRHLGYLKASPQFLTYPDIFENGGFFFPFSIEKSASTRRVFKSNWPVHTYPDIFENGGFFLRFRLKYPRPQVAFLNPFCLSRKYPDIFENIQNIFSPF